MKKLFYQTLELEQLILNDNAYQHIQTDIMTSYIY
jgi:hypothetical protein